MTKARRGYEGWMQHNYYFPPKKRQFLQDLFNIYLYMFEIWYKNPEIVTSIWKTPMFPLRWNTSDTYSDRAIHIAKKYNQYFQDSSLWLKAQIFKAEVYIQKEERDLAYENLQRVIEAVQRRGRFDDYEIARAYTFLAEIYRERKEREKALKLYEDARAIQEKLQDLIGLAISYGGIGDIYLYQENYIEAEYSLCKAYYYQQLVNDTDRLWRTCFSLVKIYLKTDNITNARTYWSHARAMILDQKSKIREDKLSDIVQQLFTMTKKYYDNRAWKDALAICLDLQVLDSEVNELAGQSEEIIAKIYIQLEDPNNAIDALYRGINQTHVPAKRADMYNLIGDTYAQVQDPDQRKKTNTCYEECIKIYIESKLNTDAHDAFDKLLRNMSASEDPSDLAPFLHGLIDIMFRRKDSFDQRFVQKAERLFKRYSLYREAGDTFFHIAQKLIQTDSTYDNEYMSKDLMLSIQNMLDKANTYYHSCAKVDDKVSGYYKLITQYFRINRWDMIAQCYREIMLALMHSNEPALLLQTFNEFNLMENKYGFAELVVVNDGIVLIDEVYSGDKERITEEQRHVFLLQWGKLLINLSRACPDRDRELYLEQALIKYNEIIETSTDTNVLSVSYNDSAGILEYINKLDEAKNRLLRSISLASENQDQVGEAQGQANYAGFLLRNGNLGEAVEYYKKSLNILQRKNLYWNERQDNNDTKPLTSSEIALLNFEKSWFAQVAHLFARVIFVNDPSQAIYWLEEARQTYADINDARQVEIINNELASVRKKTAGVQRKPMLWIPEVSIDHYAPRIQERAPVTCPVCKYLFVPDKPFCPQCGTKICPNCGSIVDSNEEFCLDCEEYVGK